MKVCMNATTVKQKENYFSVATNCFLEMGFSSLAIMSSVSEPVVILQKNPTVLLQLPGKTEWIRF